jgi:hypothetical protein
MLQNGSYHRYCDQHLLRVVGARRYAAQLTTIMVSGGNAARTDAEHNATLASYCGFCNVMSTDFLIKRLELHAVRRRADAQLARPRQAVSRKPRPTRPDLPERHENN